MIKRIIGAATALNFYLLSTGSAVAQASRWDWDWGWGWDGHGSGRGGDVAASVPEIDAGSGLLALAAVVALIALFYELRRRRVGNRAS